MGRIVKMVCVTENNNNKFYNLIQQDDATWRAEWGRVGSTSPSTKIYSMREWDKTYKAKLKRGYRDVTDLVSVAKEDESNDEIAIQGAKPSVTELINFLQNAAKGTIKKNYTVAVADVTQKQVDAAQVMLDALIALSRKRTLDRQAINKALLEMYSTIPRRMTDTRKFLLQDGETKDKFQRLLSHEQDLLDVMAGQVQTQQPKSKKKKGDLDLDDYGITIDEASEKDKRRIAKETDLDLNRVARIFTVRHNQTAKAYESKFATSSSSKEMLLYHGSRNENWWSILNNGLKIRPANAIHTGSMFGDGIYWANKARKSIGYTSLRGSYWASGSSNRAYLALFRVNVGKTWNIFANGKRYSHSEHGRLSSSKVKSAGYDSVYAKGGADLRNDEYIVYEEGRATVQYLIELKQ